MTERRAPVAAILAGGRSRRYGSPKALATIGGTMLIERVRLAAQNAAGRVIVNANDPAPFSHLSLPIVADRVPGAGPLSGVDAVLRWAADHDLPGALCIACDLPFVPAGLLRELAAIGAAGEFDVVAAIGPDLVPQPLCAYYSVRCIPEVERRLARCELAMRALLDSLRVRTLPLDAVRRWGDPAVLLLNVNTPGDGRLARQIADSAPARSKDARDIHLDGRSRDGR